MHVASLALAAQRPLVPIILPVDAENGQIPPSSLPLSLSLSILPSLLPPLPLLLSPNPTLGAGYTVEIGPLSAALSASIYRICELIKTAARWRIMKKI